MSKKKGAKGGIGRTPKRKMTQHEKDMCYYQVKTLFDEAVEKKRMDNKRAGNKNDTVL